MKDEARALIRGDPYRVVRAPAIVARDERGNQVMAWCDSCGPTVQEQDFRSSPDCAKRPVLKVSAIPLEVYP
jgi:hypothetical protein